jgi:hypothetical protein
VDCYFYSLENCLIDTQISDSVTTHTSMHLIETLTWAVPNLMGRHEYLWYRHNIFQNTMHVGDVEHALPTYLCL